MQKSKKCKKNVTYILLVHLIFIIYLSFQSQELLGMAIWSIFVVALLMLVAEVKKLCIENRGE